MKALRIALRKLLWNSVNYCLTLQLPCFSSFSMSLLNTTYVIKNWFYSPQNCGECQNYSPHIR